LRPEGVQIELLPELQSQPARAPLARPLQAQLAQAHAHRIHVVARHAASGEQRHLAPLAGVLNFDGLAPGLALAGIDLAQIPHLTLRHTAISQAARLHNAPVLVKLAVLLATLAAQEHGAHCTNSADGLQ
jgi:hypothetical protein